MTTIAAMNPQTRDPIIRLPYEPWLQCLSLAIQGSAAGPLPYLAVSRRWSETILESPTLWTRVFINNGEDEEARLHTFLHLSANQLLDVQCPRRFPVQSLQLLAQHRTRIRSLVIGFSRQYATIPTQLWSSLGSPEMGRLAFKDWKSAEPIADALISACPSLKSLENTDFIEESMIAATLEEVRVSFRTFANLGALHKCTHLRSLNMTRDVLESMPQAQVSNHFLQLSSHLGPHLVNLEITVSLERFMVFIPYIWSFVSLYSVAFTVRMPDEELPSQIATPIPKQGALNLRILSLRLYDNSHIHELPTHCDTVGHILDYLSEHQLLQDLYTFSCDIFEIPVEPVRMASLLCHLSNVRFLDLMFGPYETSIISNHRPIHMPNLLELSLRPIAWLARIEAPNLTSLDFNYYPIEDKSVTPHLSEHFGSKISHLIVEETISRAITKAYSNGVGPKFESLRTLRITDPLTAEWVVDLPSIRIIEFGYSLTLHFLLLDLLRHPGALPNLSIIRIRGYPCWELLFEVLRRRNAAQMLRIQELELPGIPVLAILSRLVKLLQGHTDVYTNRDIDEVILKRRMDERFTDTCGDCLSLGYIGCLEPLSLDGPSPSPSPSPKPFLGKDSPTDLLTLESTNPIDEHRKFQGWGDWETLMKELLHSAILSGEVDSPKMRCSRCGEEEATISEYTLPGKSSFR